MTYIADITKRPYTGLAPCRALVMKAKLAGALNNNDYLSVITTLNKAPLYEEDFQYIMAVLELAEATSLRNELFMLMTTTREKAHELATQSHVRNKGKRLANSMKSKTGSYFQTTPDNIDDILGDK